MLFTCLRSAERIGFGLIYGVPIDEDLAMIIILSVCAEEFIAPLPFLTFRNHFRLVLRVYSSTFNSIINKCVTPIILVVTGTHPSRGLIHGHVSLPTDLAKFGTGTRFVYCWRTKGV